MTTAVCMYQPYSNDKSGKFLEDSIVRTDYAAVVLFSPAGPMEDLCQGTS